MTGKGIKNMKWYTLDQPWCHSDDSGISIIAGNNDPHSGVVIADLQPLAENISPGVARRIAEYIVSLHNYELARK